MQLDVKINGNITRLYPTDDWQTIESKTALSVLENLFYINIEMNDK